MAKIKKHTPVMVVWNDAHGGTLENWDHVPEKFKPTKIISVGQMLSHTKQGLTLHMSRTLEAGLSDGYIFIPSAGVISITTLEPGVTYE